MKRTQNDGQNSGRQSRGLFGKQFLDAFIAETNLLGGKSFLKSRLGS